MSSASFSPVHPTDGPPDRPVSREQRATRTHQLLEAARHTPDEQSRDQLLDQVVLLNRGVAEAVAGRYRNRGVPAEDLEQAAFEGLVKAVQKFDPDVRPDLLTYAVPTIRGEVQRHFRDQSWMVRPPRRIQELQWRVSRGVDRLSQQLGREPTDAELTEELGCDEGEVREATRAFGCFSPPSLDQPVGGSDELTLGDTIAEVGSSAEESAEARAVLAPAMRTLSARDRRILYMRFFEEKSQSEIGETLGVTQMQVSRLLARILRDLKGQIAD